MTDVISFDVAIGEGSSLIANVEHALSLGLPELRDFEYPWSGTLKVISNGPSARQADLHGATVALNGALGLFVEKGLSPSYWAACDAHPCVADFVRNAPEKTAYLVASRCHPSVFEALKDRSVTLWHLDDEATRPILQDRPRIGTACSITIISFELFEQLGWRAFETWGWDGCRMDGAENAVPQSNGYKAQKIVLGSRVFDSSPTWGLELMDAWNKLGSSRWPIEIKGGGMFGEVFEHFRAALAQGRAGSSHAAISAVTSAQPLMAKGPHGRGSPLT